MILPSLIGISLFYILPFFASVYYAFTHGLSEVQFVGTANFQELMENAVFRQALSNTACFLLLAVPMLLLLALFLSMIIVKRKFTWQQWALLLPLVVPASSMAAGWQGLWGAGGFVNRLLGLEQVDFLRGEAAFPLLLVLYLLKNVGYISVILTSAIRALPPEYQEYYWLNSNSEAGYARRVVLPLISPTMLFAGIVAVMHYFLLFRDTYMLYGNNPPAQLYMLQHFMNNNFYKLNYQRLGAAAFLTVLLLSTLIIAVLLLQRRATRHVG